MVHQPGTKKYAADFSSQYARTEHGIDEDEEYLAFPITDPYKQPFSGLDLLYASIARYSIGMELNDTYAKLWAAIERNSQEFTVLINRLYRRTKTASPWFVPLNTA